MPFQSRRRFLSRLGLGAGAYLLSPLHHQLVGEALGQPNTRRRLFLYMTGGGFSPGDDESPGFWPKKGGSETAFELSKALSPLSPYKNELLFVESFYNPYNKHLHGNGFSTMTCVSDMGSGETKLPASISFDRWVAKTVGKGTPILSLNLCTHEVDDSDPQRTLSADGPKAVVPPLLNPVKAFAQIFGNVGTADEAAVAAAKARLTQNKSVLDAIAGDITKMRDSLAGQEKAKLEQYLTSIRDLEKQMGELAAAQTGCGNLQAPPANIYENGRRSPKQAVYRAMIDIGVNALACGLTNVVTLFAAEGELDFMPLQGASGMFGGAHQMWHGKGTFADHESYYGFQYGNVAEIRRRLGTFTEAGGTVADSTLIMNFCVTGGQHHNGQDQYFAFLLGKLGGRIKSGRYLSFPKGQRSMADVFLTAGQALGLESSSFGHAELKSTPIAGVLS